MKGVSPGRKPGRSGRVFSRGTGGTFCTHEHAVSWPATTPLAGANLDEPGDLFSVSRVRLAAGSGIPQVTSTRQRGVRPCDGDPSCRPRRHRASRFVPPFRERCRSCGRTCQACGCAPRALPRCAIRARARCALVDLLAGLFWSRYRR